MTYAKAVARIANSPYKLTRSRMALLKALIKFKGLFTAHDLTAKCPSVDLATVYRNLPVFEELGVICRADSLGEAERFMLSTPGHNVHHHHIVCRSCARIEPVDRCTVKTHERALAKLGFTQIRHRLEFSGLCEHCA